MKRIWDKLVLRPSPGQDGKTQEEELERLFRNAYGAARTTDPETRQQWARLQSSLVQSPAVQASPRTRFAPRLAFGVSLLALIAIGLSFYFTPSLPPPEIFVTGRGEQKQITLADGSEVHLHHTTELTVVSVEAGKPRQVLLRGEAFFHVRKNDTPFIITTDQASVEVLGTEFNVRSREKALEVAVIGGKVKVQSSVAGKENAIILTKDQMAITHTNEAPQFAGTIPSQDYPGWMSGKLFLNRTSFADACREIEMRFNVAIKLSSTAARAEAITGILDAGSPTSAMTALCALTGTTFSRNGNSFEVE